MQDVDDDEFAVSISNHDSSKITAGSVSVQSFRSEITDTVKSLVELNKLKIILSSGLLAVAFGIGSSSKIGDYSYLTLSLVPFICLYVDFQYYHGLAKVFVMARFLSEMQSASDEVRLVQAYERFVHKIREAAAPKLFSFESKAQIGSSMMLAIVAPLLGIVALYSTPGPIGPNGATVMVVILALSAIVGASLIWLSFRLYRQEISRMRAVPVI